MTASSRTLLTGSLTTLTPLHIAGFDEAQPHLAQGFWQRGETGRGAKVTATQRLPIVQSLAPDALAPDALVGVADDETAGPTETSANETGEAARALPWTERLRVEIPVIHATTLRGGIRRAAADVVKDALIARGQSLSLGAYQALQSGAPNAMGNSREGVDVALTHEAWSHPFVGLFGGGAYLFRSHLVVNTAVPPLDHPVVQGMLPPGCGLTPMRARLADGREVPLAPEKLVKRQWFVRRDDVLSLDDPRATRIVEDFDDETTQYAAAIEAGARDLRLIAAVELVVPGTPFGVGIELVEASEAQLGLALRALQRFAQMQRLGGMTRHGYGRFALDLTLTTPEGVQVPVFLDAAAGAAPYTLNTNAPVIAHAVATWDAAAAVLESAAFERLLCPTTEAPRRGRKAAKLPTA